MIKTVQTAILRQFQQDSGIDADFKKALTGTASSSGAVVTGVGTLFTTELKVDDYIGNATKGYRRVTEITNALRLVVEEVFGSELDADTIYKTNIKPGLPKMPNLTEMGKVIYIAFVSSADDFAELPGTTVDVIYGFLIAIGFIEPNEIDAETRKSGYEKILKDAIYKDTTFGGMCFDNTTVGKTTFVESPNSEGYYYGIMPLVVTKNEDADNR